jgi:HPt (histidine-containing phosphotransfer) domain-containing protein
MADLPADRRRAGAVPLINFPIFVLPRLPILSALGSMSHPPPNEALAELSEVLGADNVKTLVRTFLRDFPISIRDLEEGDRKNQHRFAHSMKSNARLMGAHDLSHRMAELEERLTGSTGAGLTPEDLTAIRAEFEAVAGPLRLFVAD